LATHASVAPPSRRSSVWLLAAPSVLLVTLPALVLLSTGRPIDPPVQAMGLMLAALPLATPLMLRLAGRHWDAHLLAPAWVLCALGLAVIARVQPSILPTQMLWISVGWSAFIALVGFPPLLPWLQRFRYALLGAGLLLVLVTLLAGEDVTGQGARLWLTVGPVRLQPAELLRVLLVAFIAGHLASRASQTSSASQASRAARPSASGDDGDGEAGGSAGVIAMRSLRDDWLPLLAMFGITVLAVLAQRDFGPSLIFGASLVAMLYLATGRKSYLVAAVVVGIVAFTLIYLGSDRIQDRVDAWMDPWADPRGQGYQSLQAIGGFIFGGVFGAGPGYGYPGLIPAAHTDYPLAVIGEEWGLVGSLAVVALYGLIVAHALRRATASVDAFGQLLAAGLAVSLAAQVLVVSGGVLRVVPLTGLTSPFLSYGGSSMVMAWVILALLVAAQGERGPPPPALAARVPGIPRIPRIPRIEVRARDLGLAALVGFAGLSAALGYWSVARADLLTHPAVAGERLRSEEARVHRGRILDREGRVLAETEIGPDGEPRRVYTAAGSVHVLGFTSPRVGAAGVESVASDRLMGQRASTPHDTWLDLLNEPRAGDDVTITLDADLQAVAASALEGATGAVVALDPRTGEVLAMASSPTFNPNFSTEEWDHLRTDEGSPLLNRATQGLYPPGSTFKTVTLAAAFEAGLVQPDTPATCPAEVFIDGVRIVSRNEPPGRSTQTVADAYAYSCNTFFAELGIQVGAERLRAMAEALGLTDTPPLPLPTVRGRLETTEGFLETGAGLAASAFGQGELQVSPLHLALVTAAIANDGVVPRPRLFSDQEPGEWRRAMSAETAWKMAQVMELGVEVGWASTTAIPGVRVGAKTGSAEVTAEDSPHALFIAYAPVEAPEIAVVVIKERAGSGSQQAGPVARQVIEAWLSR